MNHHIRTAMAAAVLTSLTLVPVYGAAPADEPEHPFQTVTLRVGHRAFPDWYEDHEVALREPFQVGDSDLSAEIIRFEPDFTILGDTRKIVSRTKDPNNPAFQIVVYDGETPHDTSWAFLKMPPHFKPRSLVAFKVLRIDFKGRKPLVNADTSAIQLPESQPGGGHP